MGKFDNELIEYAKVSGAFEFAVKRYLANKADLNLRQEVNSTFNQLEKIAFPIIEGIHNQNPTDADASSVYEIAYADLRLMQFIFTNL